MGRNRYQKYSDPLTSIQKRELSHKELKPEGEKKHLKIISYNSEKLIDIISSNSSTLFEKSIAKEELLRRVNRESKRRENQKPKKNKQYNKKKQEKWKKFEKVAPKTGNHTGSEYHKQYDAFIANGGDPKECPFD